MRPWEGLKYTFLQIMANKYIKNYSTLIIRKVQSKSTMYYNFIPEKGDYTKKKKKAENKSSNPNVGSRNGKWKWWSHYRNQFDGQNAIQGYHMTQRFHSCVYSQENWKMYVRLEHRVYSPIICNSPEVELSQVSSNGWVDWQSMVYTIEQFSAEKGMSS